MIKRMCVISGETKNFENAFDVSAIKLSGMPLAFYSGMYAYSGWWVWSSYSQRHIWGHYLWQDEQ